jgi:hypothetical protein
MVAMMHEETVNWLLEDENPAVKWRTMVELCGEKPENCLDVYALIFEQKPVVKMFSKQDANGLWADDYGGSQTSHKYLTACAELGLHKNEKLDNYVNHVIKNMIRPENYILQTNKPEDDLLGCVYPLMLRALVMMGYHNCDDVLGLITRFTESQLYDGGFNCNRLLKQKTGRKSCYKAAVQGLLLYAECRRKNILPNNTDKLLDYFLKRDVFYSNDRTMNFMEGKTGWRFVDNFFPAEPMRTGLPLIVYALSVLGAGNHPALSEPWELLNVKKQESGKLKLEGTLTKYPYRFGAVGKINKWVTFYALLAEKYRVC